MNPMTAAELLKEADELEAKAKRLREEAAKLRNDVLLATPILDRMIFAATARCECGAGMAYDPASKGEGVFKGPSQWECSNIIRYATLPIDEQVNVKVAMHSNAMPFAFWEVKSEGQASAGLQTTRPKPEGVK